MLSKLTATKNQNFRFVNFFSYWIQWYCYLDQNSLLIMAWNPVSRNKLTFYFTCIIGNLSFELFTTIQNSIQCDMKNEYLILAFQTANLQAGISEIPISIDLKLKYSWTILKLVLNAIRNGIQNILIKMVPEESIYTI